MVSYERRLGSVGYYEEDGGFDYMVAKTERVLEKPVQWVAVSQQFFNTTLVARNGFSSGDDPPGQRDGRQLPMWSNGLEVNLQAKIPGSWRLTELPMQLYYGPNDFPYP